MKHQRVEEAPERSQKRGQIRAAQRTKDRWINTLHLKLKPGLFTKLKEGAYAKDVSINVWVKAIFMEFTGMHPGITKLEAKEIKDLVRGSG
jgi:hypothetical protein